ncbi:hypothetical protein BH24DEI2_BH24DEI2_07940 [soil metagenome]
MSETTIETKVRAIGNSTGIILPSKVLEKLALEKGDKVFMVETKKGSFEITPYSKDVADTLEVANDIVKRYRNAFKELAK